MSPAPAEEGEEYLALVSYFRLKGIGAMPAFVLNALRVELQLLRADGPIGHSSGSNPGSLEFWSTTLFGLTLARSSWGE